MLKSYSTVEQKIKIKQGMGKFLNYKESPFTQCSYKISIPMQYSSCFFPNQANALLKVKSDCEDGIENGLYEKFDQNGVSENCIFMQG